MEFAPWEQLLLVVLLLLTLSLFVRSLWPRIQVIRAGGSDRARTDRPTRRLRITAREVLLQTRVIAGRPITGLLHAAVFGGFLFFALETADHFLKPFGLHFLASLLGEAVPLYKTFLGAWAIFVSIGIVGLSFRRFVLVKISPDPKSISSGVVALLILLLMLTYLYSMADPEAPWAKLNWWLHASIIMLFPHLIIRSKHFHILMAPLNIFFRTPRLADLRPLNLDMEALEKIMEETGEEPSFGLEKVADLSWKQRMDFLSCVECRRCTENCPANLAGQELDPRGFILEGRKVIFNRVAEEPVIGGVLSETALGQCTSCGACEAACPVGIEHLQVLIGAKQAQALSLGTGMVATEFIQTIERQGNPFEESTESRRRLIEELQIPYFAPGESDHLLWLGCVWSYNQDARSSLEAMVRILKTSGTRFGVLPEESCSGHHSRRQGEEMQFQTLAQENIERLQANRVARMIAPCPHCLHTIGQEYPTLQPDFKVEIEHHSVFIEKLLKQGSIRLKAPGSGVQATYHDPCYLGRYEGVFQAPRELIRSAGLPLLEMERHGSRAMCCGGGSAGFVREQKVELRVDQLRKQQVAETGARLLVTGCPECKMMLTAATEKTQDLAELVADALI